jgi:membrane fusion protein, copper/silver efflux system
MKPGKIAALLVFVIAVFLAGVWYGARNHEGVSSTPAKRAILHYNCPMHPQYISDRPGDCPSCGMRLVPVFAENAHEGAPADSSGSSMNPGTLHVSPQKQQLIGVQIGAAEKEPRKHTARLLGRVAVDERRIYIINAATDGWIQETFLNSTGSLVKKDEVLAMCYAPEFLGAEQAYFYALNALDRFKASGKETSDQIASTQVSIKQAADGLRNLGMGEVQIQALARDRRITQNIEIRSPATGFVLTRNITSGQRFERGDELYRIADLSRVWILVDIFENEERYVRPGERVRVTMPNQGTEVTARVTDILPQFDPQSRTLKVRLESDNPRFRLRPDMFVDVALPIDEPSTITVPADAVIDTGLKKKIFVDRGNGYFEPRDVETGWRFGSRVEILKGLMEGERIVVSGTFLIDSESRMKAAAAGIYGESAKDPVCGMDVDVGKTTAANRLTRHGGTTYYFCSDDCKNKFRANPGAYMKGGSGMMAAVAQQKEKNPAAKDLVCGMDVDPAEAKAAGRISSYHGKTYYFCSDVCKRDFDKDPGRYAK